MHWIPRSSMPQVNESDYPALTMFLADRNVSYRVEEIPPLLLHFHQQVNWKELKGVHLPSEIYHSRILVSSDYGILDGNHRAAVHRLNGDSVPAIVLSVPFDIALTVLFQFSGTYKEERLIRAA